jgi:Zn-dependent peptidase ImmA (M78 family)
MPRSSAELERVFGPESEGATEEERARSSHKVFVRSQILLGEDNDRATGHRMNALEAYKSYGWEILARIAEEGAAPLVTRPDEPAATLKARRLALNLNPQQVARNADVEVSVVEKAETPGSLSAIRDLERIAQTLALNERFLGVEPGARGDTDLGVRLRDISTPTDAYHFSPTDVLNLTEAAWVTSKQSELSRMLNEQTQTLLRKRFQPDPDYRYPTYERGYLLADDSRSILGINEHAPIESMKRLVEGTLGIPVVQQQLAERFAGATIANGADRGIVVNELGLNSNVWVRRMTMAHELGHLLWDPDARLNRVMVDRYDDLQADYVPERAIGLAKDSVEIRTNAFAVSFLAPPAAIREIVESSSDDADIVSEVMRKFGISATAAKHHIRNVSGRDVSAVSTRDMPMPSDEWVAAENMTVDWFPLKETPISRRGRFAFLVVRAFRAGLISGDTAALYLRAPEADFRRHQSIILEANQ